MDLVVGSQSSLSFLHRRSSAYSCTLCMYKSHDIEQCPLLRTTNQLARDPLTRITWISTFCEVVYRKHPVESVAIDFVDRTRWRPSLQWALSKPLSTVMYSDTNIMSSSYYSNNYSITDKMFLRVLNFESASHVQSPKLS